MDEPRLGRRHLFAAAGLAIAAAGTAACGPAHPNAPTTPTTAGGTPSGSPTAAPPTTAAPAPAPPPTLDEAQLRKKIASLLVVGFRDLDPGPDDWIMKAISQQGLGGVIVFDKDQLTGQVRNIASPAQLTALVRKLRAASPGKLIVSVDQEGGAITRLNPANGFPATQSQAQIGAANSPATTRSWAQSIAGPLASTGIGLNYAPVVDLNVNPKNPAIGAIGRSFSADPAVVVSNATEEIGVHRSLGVRTVVKHFPGLGSATGNTDFGVVDVSATWKPVELQPFQQLIAAGSVDSVMVGHLLNHQLDPSRPASLSPAVVQNLLRGQLGWRGPVVSDDMQAAAITQKYGRAEATAMAVTAGLDLLVYANQQVYDTNIVTETVDTVVAMVKDGRITQAQIDQAVARVDALRPA